MKQKIVKNILVALLLSFCMTVSAQNIHIEDTWNGSVSYSVSGNTVTLTVEPAEDYYITLDDIRVEKSVDGGVVAQAPSFSPGAPTLIEVTAVNVDDRGRGTYSFVSVDGYDVYVKATFTECISIYPSLEVSGYEWTYGDTPATMTVRGNDSNGDVTFYYADVNNADYSTTIPVDAGYYQVYALVEATGHYQSGRTGTYYFTIQKAPLSVTARSYTIRWGDPLPDFQADYEGFKNDETEAVLTQKPQFSTTATPDCEPGNYSIDVYGAEARNYEITSYTGGILSIVTWILGDANGDGSVDIADAVCIVNHVVGKPNTTFIEAAADANGDGDIDIADAVHIVNYVVGKIQALAPHFDRNLPEPE